MVSYLLIVDCVKISLLFALFRRPCRVLHFYDCVAKTTLSVCYLLFLFHELLEVVNKSRKCELFIIFAMTDGIEI